MILRNSTRNRFLNPISPVSTVGPNSFRGVSIQYGQTRNLSPAETVGRRMVIDPTQVSRGGLAGTIAHEYTHYTQQYTPARNPLQWAANLAPRAVAGQGGLGTQLLAGVQAAAYSLLPGGPKPFELGGQTGAINTLNEMMPWGNAPGVGLGRTLQPLIYPNLPAEGQVRREANITQSGKPPKPISLEPVRAIAQKAIQSQLRRTRTPAAGGSRAF